MDSIHHLRNMVIMAVVDGEFTEREITFLVDRSRQLGLDVDDLEDSIAYALTEDPAISLPQDPQELVDIFKDLVRIMAADGKLSDLEKRLFSVAAAKGGLDTDEINAIFDSVLPKKPQ